MLKNIFKSAVKWRNFLVGLTLFLCVFFAVKALLGEKVVPLENGQPHVYTEMNNYQIFKQVFWHTVAEKPLYKTYPKEYFDRNHYGIFFSVVIAPFAILPDWAGVVLWSLANVLLLLFAFQKLHFTPKQQCLVLLLMLNDFANAALNTQSNPAIAAMIILALVYVRAGKDHWATFFIFFGFFIKLYTIVALPFFLFSKNKKRFIIYSVCWCVVFFTFPMLFSSVDFVLQSYVDWFARLSQKNAGNLVSSMQDMGIGGFFRAVFDKKELSNVYFLTVGLVLLALPYFRFDRYKNTSFQELLLVLLLIFPVIFSSSTESPTYIIAVAGVSIWAAGLMPQKPLPIFILLVTVVFTMLSSTDVFPSAIKNAYFYPYKVKAIGATLVFCYVTFQAFFLPLKKTL